MNEPNIISELRLIGKGKDVIEFLSIDLPTAKISVPYCWGTGKKWPPDGRAKRLSQEWKKLCT